MRNTTLFLLCFSCFFCTGVLAQTTVRGFVLADDGTPLPYASVYVAGTTVGTWTDVDGYYEISLPARIDTLTFSYVGYASTARALTESSEGNWLEVDLFAGSNLPAVIVYGAGFSSVERCCYCGCGSRVSTFTFPKITIGQETDLAQSSVYPNPFQATINLRTDLWAANRLTVQLLNGLGQVVRNWGSQPVEVGEQHLVFSVPDNLPANPYFLRLSDDLGREVTKTIVKSSRVSH